MMQNLLKDIDKISFDSTKWMVAMGKVEKNKMDIGKISIELSNDELKFLDWAMSFLEGGPFDDTTEEKRKETAFKIKEALNKLDKGIFRSSDNGAKYIVCAYCDGSGCFPEPLPDGNYVEPCPVCNGLGHNIFYVSAQDIMKCKFCGGEGGVFGGDSYKPDEVCTVCKGTGIIVLNGASTKPRDEDIWGKFHPILLKVSKSRYETKHYADAVEAAFKEINKIIKEIVKSQTGEEMDGAQLMNRAFSPKHPIITLEDLSTETGKNIQQGYMQIFAGTMIGIRNPNAHENMEMDCFRAIHLLSLASLLLFKLDECKMNPKLSG